jgi:hypothetical protein
VTIALLGNIFRELWKSNKVFSHCTWEIKVIFWETGVILLRKIVFYIDKINVADRKSIKDPSGGGLSGCV